MIEQKPRINVGTIGHIDWGKPTIYIVENYDIDELSPLLIHGDHGKRSKKGKRKKDWQD